MWNENGVATLSLNSFPRWTLPLDICEKTTHYCLTLNNRSRCSRTSRIRSTWVGAGLGDFFSICGSFVFLQEIEESLFFQNKLILNIRIESSKQNGKINNWYLSIHLNSVSQLRTSLFIYYILTFIDTLETVASTNNVSNKSFDFKNHGY